MKSQAIAHTRMCHPAHPVSSRDPLLPSPSRRCLQVVNAHRAEVQRLLMEAGIPAAAAHEVSTRFGSTTAARLAYSRCAPAARAQLLCPDLRVTCKDNHWDVCFEARRPSRCCELSAKCYRVLGADDDGTGGEKCGDKSCAAEDAKNADKGVTLVDMVDLTESISSEAEWHADEDAEGAALLRSALNGSVQIITVNQPTSPRGSV